jgi:hypothetical protein
VKPPAGSLKQKLRNLLFPSRFMADMENMRLTQGKILAELNRAKTLPALHDCEFSVFSQWGEDGIIQRLISEVGIANRTFIEFGVENFSESNCRFLMVNNNWQGFVIDGSEKWIESLKALPWWWKYELRAHCALLNTENVNRVLSESGFDRDVGILSVDVDGIDYWLLEAITAYTPRILIVEYNSLFGAERKISVPYEPMFSRRARHYSDLYFGASLGALTHIAERKGYSLVGTESSGVNAFFLRNDVLGARRPLSVAEAFTQSNVRECRDREGKRNFFNREERYAEIRGLPVVNVETGATETV